MAGRHRVVTSSKSFDLERFSGLDKAGAEIWLKVAYCRNRRDLLASLASRRLSADLARDVPSHHQDAYRLLSSVAGSPNRLSEGKRASLAKATAARAAKRQAETTPKQSPND